MSANSVSDICDHDGRVYKLTTWFYHPKRERAIFYTRRLHINRGYNRDNPNFTSFHARIAVRFRISHKGTSQIANDRDCGPYYSAFDCITHSSYLISRTKRCS